MRSKLSEHFTGVQIRWRPDGPAAGGSGGSGKFPVGAVIAIGRDSDNDIVLRDQEVSRKHARLVVGRSDVTFTDLRSRNGSRIDGRRRLGTTSWQPGQMLQIGNHLLEVEFVLVVPDTTAAPAPTPGGAILQPLPPSSDEWNHAADVPTTAADTVAVEGVVAKSPPASNEPPSPTVSGAPALQPEREGAAAKTANVARAPVQDSPPQGAEHREPPPKPVSEIAAQPVAAAEIKPNGAPTEAEILESVDPAPAEPRPEGVSEVAADTVTDAAQPGERVIAACATPNAPAPRGLAGRGHSPHVSGLETGQLPIRSETEFDPAAADDELIHGRRRAHVVDLAAAHPNKPHRAHVDHASVSVPGQVLTSDADEQGRRYYRARWFSHRAMVALAGLIGLLLLVGAVLYRLNTSIPFPNFGKSASSIDVRADARPTPTQEPQLRIDPGMHSAPIWRIAVNTPCSLLATGSDDKTLRVRRLPEGKLLSVLRPPIGPTNEGRVNAVAMAPNGSWVAAGGFKRRGDHWVYIFQTNTRPGVTFPRPTPHIISPA